VDTSRRLRGTLRWSHQGSSRVRPAPVVDPALIRALEVGQAAYIYRGGVTYVQVKRLVAGPAALPVPAGPDPDRRTPPARPDRVPAPAGPDRAVTPVPPPTRLPDVTAVLDEAFGTEPAS